MEREPRQRRLCMAQLRTLAHAFRFDGARMQEYVESHARALILAGRR
ncbi:hypothetical protein [Streptomyces sp. NPDC007088]